MFSSDLKVRIDTSDVSTFPDVSIVCGPVLASTIDPQSVTNPTLLVEVTSPSTEDYDRSEKLSHYKQLPSVQAVLFVSHRTPRVTVVTRTTGGWSETEHRGGELIELTEPHLSFAVDELYSSVNLN